MAEIEALARRHDFPSEFDLTGRLSHCWEWWRGSVQMGPDPPASVRRAFLRELAERAEALEYAIERTGVIERREIHATISSSDLDFEQLKRSVHRLWLGATAGALAISRSPPGRRGDVPLTELIFQLLRLYVQAFGVDAPKLTGGSKASDGRVYSGRFFDFVDNVLRMPSFDVSKSNLALGKAIEKVLGIVKRRNIQLSSSRE